MPSGLSRVASPNHTLCYTCGSVARGGDDGGGGGGGGGEGERGGRGVVTGW